MYFYYFLTELGYRPSWAFAITVIQIVQMIVGIVLNTLWAYLWFDNNNCECTSPKKVLAYTLVMYGSYLYLFVVFFLKRYFDKRAAGVKKYE
jgi:elongation of very long chain fatty acids protein 6